MPSPLLSVIIPVYNEEQTIRELVDKVKAVPLDKEIIVVDDGSTDHTFEFLSEMSDILLLQHEKNLGKGAAIQTALQHVKGQYVIFQDGDLETDPHDFVNMIYLIQKDNVDVVFGSRFLHYKGEQSFITLGNKLITWWANRLNTQKITDLAASYKLIPRDILINLNIQSRGFGLEAEMVAKIDRLGLKIKETPIYYHRRLVMEGKKLRILDGVVAAWSCLKFRLLTKQDKR